MLVSLLCTFPHFPMIYTLNFHGLINLGILIIIVLLIIMLCGNNCQSFDHDANSCPYYDIFDECYARLNAMIEIMNERHMHFVSQMRECGLLHETDHSQSSPTLEISLYDDYEYFLPIEPDFIVDTPSIGLEEVIDAPLISLPFVAPSLFSTPGDTTTGDLTCFSLPFSSVHGVRDGRVF